MMDENILRIYTDGSSINKPRRGGIGIRYIYIDTSGDEVIEDQSCIGYQSATNNEMELQACVLGLEYASSYLKKTSFDRIVVFTDSSYVVDNLYNAKFIWPKTKWCLKDGGPVLNAELWKKLVKNIKRLRLYVDIKKVKGHSKDIHNKAVDKLAKESARKPFNKPLSIWTARRKLSKEKTVPGSVDMLGQRLRIRIIGGQYLKTQHIYRYRYEVMSKNCPFYRKVDFICSLDALRETHTYSVRLNNDRKNPFISKVFGEIT